MENIKLEDIRIKNTFLSEDVKKKLISKNIDCICVLKKYNLLDLMEFDNVNYGDIVHIKAVLNGDYNVHLEGEELIDYTDMFDEKRSIMIRHLDLAVKFRNYYKKLSKKGNEESLAFYTKRVQECDLRIIHILNSLISVRDTENNLERK